MHDFTDINLKLCNYCGTCVGICPVDALTAEKERIIYDKNKCTSCGLCHLFCPGIEVSFPELNEHFFKGKSQNMLGFYKSIFVAHSKDEEIRENASSGGIVTSLLVYLLENRLIDGAVVVGMSTAKPWRYEIKIAKNKEELIEAAQSKYSLVPLNTILKKLKNETGRFALVGLPCHIHGIRKLQMKNNIHTKKIEYLIGLFCGFNLHYSATDFLIQKLGVKTDEIEKLEYRSGKWPGGFLIRTKSGKRKFVEKFGYNFLIPAFVPERCLLCIDLMNEFADISVGDAWLKNLNKSGWSTVITRTKKGDTLFKSACKDGYIFSKKITKKDVFKSHSHLIKYKKYGSLIWIDTKDVKPRYDIKNQHIKFYTFPSEILFILTIKVARNKYVRRIMSVFPLPILAALSKMIRKLIT